MIVLMVIYGDDGEGCADDRHDDHADDGDDVGDDMS